MPRRDLKEVPKETLERMSFAEKYEGYVFDLVFHLAEKLKFKYTIHMVGDGKYGGIGDDGEWNGIIRELQDQKADLGVIDLSITSIRQKAVDFSMPYMSTGENWMMAKIVFEQQCSCCFQVWVSFTRRELLLPPTFSPSSNLSRWTCGYT
jgi:hypothetical protein